MPKLGATLAQNLIIQRKRKGFTQTQFAKAAGTSRATIARYESGKGGLDGKTIATFAEILGVEETDLTQPQKAYTPKQGEVPDEFIEFIREARKSEHFYKDIIESITEKMNAQSKVVEKLLIREGILKPEDLHLNEEISHELAIIPHFSFPSQSFLVLPDDIVDMFSQLTPEEAETTTEDWRRGLKAVLDNKADLQKKPR